MSKHMVIYSTYWYIHTHHEYDSTRDSYVGPSMYILLHVQPGLKNGNNLLVVSLLSTKNSMLRYSGFSILPGLTISLTMPFRLSVTLLRSTSTRSTGILDLSGKTCDVNTSPCLCPVSALLFTGCRHGRFDNKQDTRRPSRPQLFRCTNILTVFVSTLERYRVQ